VGISVIHSCASQINAAGPTRAVSGTPLCCTGVPPAKEARPYKKEYPVLPVSVVTHPLGAITPPYWATPPSTTP